MLTSSDRAQESKLMDNEQAASGKPERGGARRRGAGRLLRVLGAVAVAGLSAYVGGFLVFADAIANAHPPERPRADGIVALTGGAQRIEDAAALLGQGSGERLLITGLNEQTTGGALAGRSRTLANLLRCCVDLDYEAQDTRGNAAETGEWARKRGYDSLIVVTSAYHMPRSLAEIGDELPEVELVPYPVNPDARDYSRWESNPEIFRLLLTEYTKYIVTRLS